MTSIHSAAPHVKDLIRAVALPHAYGCMCGFQITHVGVALNQPQPCSGDYTACPECLAIYQLDADLTPRLVPEKFIPTRYLGQRDKLLARMRHQKDIELVRLIDNLKD